MSNARRYSRARESYIPGVGVLAAHGTSVPSDGEAGYAPGCIFQKTDGSADACFYVNQGTLTSCNFDSLDVGALTGSNVSVADSAGYFTGTNAETVLAEIGELMLVPSGTAAGAGPSPLIWDDCPVLEMMVDPTVGYHYFDDFFGNSVAPGAGAAAADGWTLTQATSGTMGSVIGVGGVVQLSAGAATADQGINAQLLNCCVKPAAEKTIWFEARVKVSHIDNQIFVGLASTDTSLIATGALDETNPSLIGFFTDVNSTSTKYGTCTSKAGTNDTTEDIAVGFAAATWAKVGFKVTGVSKVEFFYDGALVETGETANAIPDAVELALSLVCQNEDGANTNTLDVDWVRVAQLR